MRRRDFVKGILAASAAAKTLGAQQSTTAAPAPIQATPPPGLPPHTAVQAGPTPWMTGLMEVKPLELPTVIPDAVAQTDAHFFSTTQAASLRRLCELLMPRIKSYPSAVDVGTPEFLDFLIGASPQPQQRMYRMGLDRLEAEAHSKFALSFAKLSDAQADQLIRPWLRAWMSDHPPTEPYAYFVNTVHHDIRQASINSQQWNIVKSAEEGQPVGLDLYWYPIDPLMQGRVPQPARNAATPATEHRAQ